MDTEIAFVRERLQESVAQLRWQERMANSEEEKANHWRRMVDYWVAQLVRLRPPTPPPPEPMYLGVPEAIKAIWEKPTASDSGAGTPPPVTSHATA